MNVLDRAITWAFPAWGARRLAARYLARSYDSVDITRDRPIPRRSDPGPISDNRQSRKGLLDDARDLDKNNAFAHGVFNSIVDNVVGGGIRLESRMRSTRGRLRRPQNEAIEAEWNEWARGVDATGTIPFWQLQRLVERELWVANEVLIVQSSATDGRRVPLTLELVESERLAPVDSGADVIRKMGEGNSVIQGVEFTPSGTIAAYHIYDAHPSDSFATIETTRVPSNRVLHLFHPRRPGEVRGTSRTAAVAKSFLALNQYLDFELTKARIASAFAVLLTRSRGRSGFALPSTGDSADATDSAANDLGYITSGMIIPGQQGDDIKAVGSSITSTAFDPFVTLILRMIAAGLNVSYEIMTRDFSKHNFSSIRQSFLEDRRHWEPRQSFLIERLCWPVWNWFTGVAFLRAIDPFAAVGPNIRQVNWIPGGWDWVDPLKEKQADALGAKVGFQNVKLVAARHGQDVIQNVEDLAEIKELFEEKGIPLPQELFGGNGNTNETQESPPEGAEAPESGQAAPGRKLRGRARVEA